VSKNNNDTIVLCIVDMRRKDIFGLADVVAVVA
jgi:hypothetical protein